MPGRGTEARILAAIVLTAVVVRLGAVAVSVRGGSAPSDADLYLPLAESLAAGRGFALWDGRPTAIRPPLYPLVLAPLVAILGDRAAWGAVGLNLLLGALTVIISGQAARCWGLSPHRSRAAALIVALDPVLVAQSRAVMTETLAAFLVAGTIRALGDGSRTRSCWHGGILLGLASLCRPSLLPAAAVLTLAALVVGPGSPRVRLGRCGRLAGGVLLMVSPWAIRNAIVLGEPVATTTHGGYTLGLANNPYYYDDIIRGARGSVWSGPGQSAWFESVRRRVEGLTEPQADRRLRDDAVRVMLERPGDFLRSAAARLGRFWGVAPASAVYSTPVRLATTIWTIPFLAIVVRGLFRPGLWRWPAVTAPGFVIALTIVHIFFWTDLRMRAPLVPALALIAAGARRPGTSLQPEKIM